MWYVTQAVPGAELYVGLRNGVSKEGFEAQIGAGTVEQCFHRSKVSAGDAMFLPSGRVHAIAGGLVIFEIQQNSDTTYRVFDWNRLDAAGKGRTLHVRESLECIDFEDFEPEIIQPEQNHTGTSTMRLQTLVEDLVFKVDVVATIAPGHIDYSLTSARIIGVVEGRVFIPGEHALKLLPGQFALVPASAGRLKIETEEAARFLVAQPR
jgi:mannose-6-phosphate isomerase